MFRITQHTGSTILSYSLPQTNHTHYRSSLLQDSLLVFSSALSSLALSSDPVSARLNCAEPGTVATQGQSMMEEILRSRVEGLTGEIRFLGGKRENLEIQLVKMGKEVVGMLSTGTRELQMEKDFIDCLTTREDSVDIIIVVSIIYPCQSYSVLARLGRMRVCLECWKSWLLLSRVYRGTLG